MALNVGAIDPMLRDRTDIGARIENASLLSTAPEQQCEYDGWLLRHSPGKAKRARSIHPVAPGRLPLPDKIEHCVRFYQRRGLPCLYRITPFSQDGIDDALAAAGYAADQDTRVMCTTVFDAGPSIPAGRLPLRISALSPRVFGETFAALHQLPPGQARAELQRYLRIGSSATARFLAAYDGDRGEAIACGCGVIADDLLGVFGMVTDSRARNHGVASAIVAALLQFGSESQVGAAYLQVEVDNAAARRVYRKFGFDDVYAYWYRQAPSEDSQ